MSGVGSSELIILLLIGLIILGPKRLPQIANQLGSWIGQARRMTRVMKRQLEEELRLDQGNIINPPPVSPTTAHSDSAAGQTDHIPADDDTYSPLHGDEEDAEQGDEPPGEKPG